MPNRSPGDVKRFIDHNTANIMIRFKLIANHYCHRVTSWVQLPANTMSVTRLSKYFNLSYQTRSVSKPSFNFQPVSAMYSRCPEK